MDTIREMVQTLTGGNLEPSNLLSLGENVFLSENAVVDQKVVHEIARFYQSIHATTYGNAIPNTAGTATHATTATNDFEEVLGVSTNNEVLQPTAINAANAGLAPVNILFGIGSTGFAEALIAPGTTYYLQPSEYPQILKNGGLTINQLDGSAGEITVNVAYHKVVQ